MYKRFIKRVLDFWIALLILIIFSPLLLIIIIILLIINKGAGVFFIQERTGKNAKIFKAVKFKTMTEELDEKGILLPDKDRITKAGKILRTTSLDEIPQLINVLTGDMSLIGPRPLLKKYIPLYTDEQIRRHDVKPGLTGWAQVNGRNNIAWKRKFELDVWYVDNLTFTLDMKIIFLTLKKVLLRENISKYGATTTDAFDGTN